MNVRKQNIKADSTSINNETDHPHVVALKLSWHRAEQHATLRVKRRESRRTNRFQGRRGPRQGSGRRKLLREVVEKWPELGDERKWKESPLLKPENQDQLLSELKQLPSWKTYDDRRQQMEITNKESDQRELRTVKLRKLINTSESIVLERNLPLFATPQIVDRYQQLLTLEESSLSPAGSNR